MAGPVTFNYATWVAGYPEFSLCNSDQGQAWFDRACLLCANATCNIVFPTGNLPALLYLLTSHIAWLSAPRDAQGRPSATGQPPSPLVGRISSASEGSVNVSVEWKGSGSPSEDWYIQTPYGALYWQCTAWTRTFRYAARPTIVADGVYPYLWNPSL